MATKNINAEKIRKGNLDVSAISATTFNINNQYDLPNSLGTNGDFLMYSGGSASWEFIEPIIITGTTGGTIPFVNSFGTGFEYKSGFNFDGDKLNITKTPNVGVSLHKEGAITISGDTGGVINISGYSATTTATTISSDNDLLIISTGTTLSVFGQEKQLYLSSSNPYVGINTTTPQATLHVKGNSNTTGDAFISNGGNNINSNSLRAYNNHSTINSGTTYFEGGVNIGMGTNNSYKYTLPTISGKTSHVLTRTDSLSNRAGGTAFNVFWIDHRDLGNSLWLTGNTNGIDYMYPSLSDVEIISDYSYGIRNIFYYDSSSSNGNFISYDNLFNTYGCTIGGGTSTYKKSMNNVLLNGHTMQVGNDTAYSDYGSSVSNVLISTSGTRLQSNGLNVFYDYTNPIYSAITISKNVAIVGQLSGTFNAVQNVFCSGYNSANIRGAQNTHIFGDYNVGREREYQKPWVNSNDYVLGIKNIIAFGGGKLDGTSIIMADNTVTFGAVNQSLLIGTGEYYKNTYSGGNYYNRQFPSQTEGIWFGSKGDSTNAGNAALGMFTDPLLSGTTDTPLNLGFGTRNTFNAADQSSSSGHIPLAGINRPGAGAGIFYMYAEYNITGSRGDNEVPTSGVTNSVALVANERYTSNLPTDMLHPLRVTGTYINTDANRGHWIGDALFVNPKKEFYKRLPSYSNTFQLSGSTGTLDVIGSGSTSGTTSVRIKNSGDTVGLEVLDDGQVYFNGIPTGAGGLSPGWLYKDNISGELSIVSGSSIAGNYVPAISSQHLELSLLSQTQVYSNAGTTVITDGSLVQQINDLSGNNNHATQTTSGDRLTWNVSASTINNYSYFSNIDTSRFMNLTNGISLSASSVDDTGFGINIVMRINSTDTFRLFESSTTTDFFGEFSYDVLNSNCDWTHSGSTASVTTAGSILYNLGDWVVFSFYNYVGADYLYSRINDLNNQGSYIPSNVFRNLDKILVGGDIDVAEITIYNRPNDANDDNFADISSEISRLMTKYNIT